MAAGGQAAARTGPGRAGGSQLASQQCAGFGHADDGWCLIGHAGHACRGDHPLWGPSWPFLGTFLLSALPQLAGRNPRDLRAGAQCTMPVLQYRYKHTASYSFRTQPTKRARAAGQITGAGYSTGHDTVNKIMGSGPHPSLGALAAYAPVHPVHVTVLCMLAPGLCTGEAGNSGTFIDLTGWWVLTAGARLCVLGGGAPHGAARAPPQVVMKAQHGARRSRGIRGFKRRPSTFMTAGPD